MCTSMPMNELSRREFAKLIAAAGVASRFPQIQITSRVIGIQVGAVSFLDEGIASVLDRFQRDSNINALFVAGFTYGRGIAGRQVPGQPLPDHDETILRRLRKDPDFAAEYLKAALEDEDEPRVLLIALRHLAQAQGIAKVARAAGIERESLYRALSVHGNPRLSTLVAITKAIGLRLTVEAAK